jgi:hypothetical protein
MAKKKTFDEMWGVADPADIARPQKKEDFDEKLRQYKATSQVVRDVAGKIKAPIKKGLGTGMGVLGWPLERASAIVGTPARELTKEHRRTMERFEKGEKLGLVEQIVGVGKALGRSVPPVAKSLVSKKLHPETTTIMEWMTEDVLKNMSEQDKFVMGLAAEFAITPAMVGKALELGAKGVKLTGIPQKIVARGLPQWQRMKLRARMKTGARVERAQEVTKPLHGKEVKKIAQELSKRTGKPVSKAAVEQRLGQIVKGGITEQPALQKAAAPAIGEIARTSKELKSLGILPEKTYITKLTKKQIAELLRKKSGLQKQLTRLETAPHYVGTREISKSFPGRAKRIRELQGKIDDITTQVQQSYKTGGAKYMPRMFTTKEEVGGQFSVYSKHRIRAQYAKQRQKIPFEVRQRMGEIKTPAYPVQKRLIQESADIETAKLFRQAAARPDWASSVARPGFKQLPDTKGYGALKNKYVHPKIYEDATELIRIRGNFEKTYDSLIGSWKLGKVVLNPATHFRNKISNKVLLDMSGMGFAEQAKYAGRALKEWNAKSKEYQVAKRYFARTTMVKGELLDDILRTTSKSKGTGFEKALNAMVGGGKKALAKPAELYQHEEFVNKFMKYLQQRDLGKSVIQSVEEANKWLFDYGELSKWERLIARRVMPFYTFPRKALPRVAEAMVTRPHTIAKYPLMAQLTTQYSLSKLELTDKDYAEIKKTLPDYMNNGSYILMPYRDDNGDLRFFDWTYTIPWGEIAEVGERGVLKSVVTNPLVNMVGDIKRNKTSFTEREIWKETDTRKEKFFKGMKYVWQNLMPALTPKGLYWDKLEEAATGKPSVIGKKRPLPETIAHTVFGLRTQPIDVKRQKGYKYYERQKAVEELSKKLNTLGRERKVGRISEKEFIKKRNQYKKQLQELNN